MGNWSEIMGESGIMGQWSDLGGEEGGWGGEKRGYGALESECGGESEGVGWWSEIMEGKVGVWGTAVRLWDIE